MTAGSDTLRFVYDASGCAWYDDVWEWLNDTAEDFEDYVEEVIDRVSNVAYQIYYDATKWHFEDRIAANGEHPTYDEVKNDTEWTLLPRSQSLYHIDDVGKDELKYVHPDGREAVFNGDTLNPMLDSQYMATYNYVALMPLPDNPSITDYVAYGVRWIGHGICDVAPYVLLGGCNTREDFEARIIEGWRYVNMSKKIIAAILVFHIMLSGCGKMVDSYMEFSITQFEEFLSAADDQKGDYLTEGKLDFAKTAEVFLVPFIKETTHEECTLFVYAYWTDSPKEICITDISLISQNDVTIFYGDSAAEEIKIMWQKDALSEGVIEIGSFSKNEDWFSNRNNLVLSFSVSVSTDDGTVSTDYVYEVTLHQTKNFLFPT